MTPLTTMIFGLIFLAGGLVVCSAKVKLLTFEWYVVATALFCVGAFLLWSAWSRWREQKTLWGKSSGRGDSDSVVGNIDLFPDD